MVLLVQSLSLLVIPVLTRVPLGIDLLGQLPVLASQMVNGVAQNQHVNVS